MRTNKLLVKLRYTDLQLDYLKEHSLVAQPRNWMLHRPANFIQKKLKLKTYRYTLYVLTKKCENVEIPIMHLCMLTYPSFEKSNLIFTLKYMYIYIVSLVHSQVIKEHQTKRT